MNNNRKTNPILRALDWYVDKAIAFAKFIRREG